MDFRWILASMVGLLVVGAGTRVYANVPPGGLQVEQSGDQVRLDLYVHFFSEYFQSCEVDIRRTNGGSSVTVFSGELGVASETCVCEPSWVLSFDPPTEDATACDPLGEWTDTCPGDSQCRCTRHCTAIFDTLCKGRTHYDVVWEPSYDIPRAVASYDASQGQDCAVDGCGCTATGEAPHLLVGLLLLLGLIMPGWLLRRKQAR